MAPVRRNAQERTFTSTALEGRLPERVRMRDKVSDAEAESLQVIDCWRLFIMATLRPTGSARNESDRQLKKALSFQDLFFLSMGGIIGSGWLLAALAASSLAGPAVILSWIIGGVLVLFIALTYAEVAGMIPRSGAIVRYPHMTHGGFTGFLLGWAYFLTAVTVPTIETEAVVTYADKYVHGLTTTSGVLTGAGIAIAIGLMIVFFFLNYFGVRLLGRLNTIITWWKFIIPTITFIFLFFLFRASNFTAGGFFAQGVPSVFEAVATSGIVFSYLGFRQALDFGGEARNPQRDVPLATIVSVITGTVLYTILQIAFIGAVNWRAAGVPFGGWSGLANSAWATGPFASELTSTSIAAFAAFAVLLYIDAVVSPSGTGMVYTGTSTRSVFGLTLDGYFPPVFSRISRYGVPVVSLGACVIVGWLFLAPLPSWYQLVGFISSATVLTYIMGGVSLTVFRRTAGELHRPFQLPFSSVLAPVAFIAAALVVYWSSTKTLNYVVGAVLIGLPLYAWFYAPTHLGVNRTVAIVTGIVYLVAVLVTGYFGPFDVARFDFSGGGLNFPVYLALLFIEVVAFSAVIFAASPSPLRREIPAGAWFIVFLMGVYIISYVGEFGPLPASQRLAFPIGTIIVAVFSLGIYYWAVASGYTTEEIADIVAAEGSTGSQRDVIAPESAPGVFGEQAPGMPGEQF